VTLRRWTCGACELLILVAADYAMVACPGCGSPALQPEKATGEVAALWCPRCSSRFDLYIDELDPANELLYCPRCRAEMLASKTIVGHPKYRANVVPWEPPWPLEGLVVYAYLDGEVVVYAVLAGTVVCLGVLDAEEVAVEDVLYGTIAVEQVLEDEIAIDYEYPLDGDLYVNGEKV
jgi:DNA-directed RNA polymerase subunit RPC12/RpoP